MRKANDMDKDYYSDYETRDKDWIPTGEEMGEMMAGWDKAKELLAQLDADWNAFKQKRGW